MNPTLICIDDETDILKLGDGIKELTYGKEYEVKGYPKSERAEYISVINDKGVRNEYYSNRFVTLNEYREIRINKVIK